MKTRIAILASLISFVTGCASEDDGSPRAMRMLGGPASATAIRALPASVSEDETMLTYGADVVRFYPPAARRPSDLSESHDVLDAWPVKFDDVGPVKLSCGGAAGALCTWKCVGASCTSGPPPPVAAPYGTDPNKLALRRSGLVLPAGTGAILVGGAPSMLVLAGGARLSLDQVSEQVWSWVKDQRSEIVLHVYYVVDPAGTHPLHRTVIAIPVRITPTP